MEKIAIKPHKTRGQEIIKILESMGGNNFYHFDGFSSRDDTAYLIDEIGIINSYTEHLCHEKGYKIYTLEGWEAEHKSDEMIEGLAEEGDMGKAIEEAKTYWDGVKDAIILPEGYEFKDENGNVIPVKKIILEKKKLRYPKTYKECCKILKEEFVQNSIGGCYIAGYFSYKLECLQKLLIHRDAYWKIAGDEMGLGKPWKPDWKENSIKHTILYSAEGIILNSNTVINRILAFPTPEMRDAFYENFKELIAQCKEIL